jgi:hypothetical protein
MSTESKRDPFNPQQPAIPGVPADDPNKKKVASPRPAPKVTAPVVRVAAPPPPIAPTQERSRQMMAIAACLIACALVAGMAITWVLHRSSAQVAAAVDSTADATPAADSELPAPSKPPANLPLAPGVVAKADELAKPWSSKSFIYHDPITSRDLPAMVVRLPRGGYWGFSMMEPFGSCELEWVTNLDRLQSVYDYHADHPMVGDPCNHAVFDLLQYGGPPSAEVRGAPVRGMGVRPPIAIEIEQHGNEISATKIE